MCQKAERKCKCAKLCYGKMLDEGGQYLGIAKSRDAAEDDYEIVFLPGQDSTEGDPPKMCLNRCGDTVQKNNFPLSAGFHSNT